MAILETNSQLKTGELCWRSFIANVPLLTATSAFRLGRRHQSSPQRCYLHYLHTMQTTKTMKSN